MSEIIKDVVDETDVVAEDEKEQKNAPETSSDEATPINISDYDPKELIKANKGLQGLIDRRMEEERKKATEKESERMKLLYDTKVSEEARFKNMTAEEKIAELELKNAMLEEKFEREKAADELRRTVETSFAEKGIPPVMANLIDFMNTPAERCKELEELFSDFEYYPKGELDRRITDEVNKRLKSKSPETHVPSGKRDYQAEFNKAKATKNNAQMIAIKMEAQKNGVILR